MLALIHTKCQATEMSNLALNLSSLKAEEFEDLVEAVFRAKVPKLGLGSVETQFAGTVTEVSRSGRGQDGGLDILVTTVVRDCIASRMIRWVVQCKHKTNGRSVAPHDFAKEFHLRDVLVHHNANSYLLVCSTRPSAKLKSHLDKLTQDSNNEHYIVWDYAQVCQAILSDESVMKQFFPLEYQRQKGLVESQPIGQWAHQFKDSISEDAFAALNNIVPLDSPRINDEDEGR